MNPSHKVLRLYPGPTRECALEGLYLEHPMDHGDGSGRPFVYTNFISSLDGRIAVEDPRHGGHSVPGTIINDRDWRLFQELAARADALLVSARFLRDLATGKAQDVLPVSRDPAYGDLHEWRAGQGLPPQPAVVVLTRTLDPALAEMCEGYERPVYFAVGAEADRAELPRVEAAGVRVLSAGRGTSVEGAVLVDLLAREGLSRLYSIAGPWVLDTLLRDGVLHRLYLTHFHRLLGGRSFDTMLEGDPLDPPPSFEPHALYYDPRADDGVGQFFAVYDTLMAS
ncbi:MAG: dihydrofolate reductase family protein [Gammaproteobacteria bacterium]|nr:dihydrofolate reductase family protein [Gammaproteobacteria bacterium]